jgi:6-phosphogluconolactonase
MQKHINWHVLENSLIATTAQAHILASAKKAIAEHGSFKLVLAGGSTPEKVYGLLAKADAEWSLWHIYYGDERCVPVDNADRNSVMAQNSLLNAVAIPKEQIFTIPAESGPVEGARQYQQIVADALPFDMVLLGIGEDGHTASLFPSQAHDPQEMAHAVYNSPKPPPERVSISAKALSDSTEVLFLITGAGKLDAVNKWRAGENLPVASISAHHGVDVYIDTEAFQ